MTVKVIVNGAHGRMGQEAVKAIEAEASLSLVGSNGKGQDLAGLIKSTGADVVVDLTVASVVLENVMTVINSGARPVVGTSGLMQADIDSIFQICDEKQLGGLIVPNFSIGAVLMMQMAAQAAQYLPDVEIIEMHHNQKEDAPSGTAIRTADMMAEARKEKCIPLVAKKETVVGTRGGTYRDTSIHAVRLPGLVASQQVLFGGHHETLSIRHDTLNRSCFMPGVILACQKVMTLNGLKVGLESVM